MSLTVNGRRLQKFRLTRVRRRETKWLKTMVSEVNYHGKSRQLDWNEGNMTAKRHKKPKMYLNNCNRMILNYYSAGIFFESHFAAIQTQSYKSADNVSPHIHIWSSLYIWTTSILSFISICKLFVPEEKLTLRVSLEKHLNITSEPCPVCSHWSFRKKNPSILTTKQKHLP